MAPTRLNPAGVEGDLPLTIDELFDELERQVSGDSFVATYDPQLGFPVSVEVDQMLNAVDDELEVRVADLVAGVPAAVVDQPPSIGQRVEATAIVWPFESPDGVSFWLVVDAAGGVTIDGSSRLSVQVPVGEVRCGAELRPIETFESLQGPATVSFEVTALAADAPPDAGPMWQPDWPAVSGRAAAHPDMPADHGGSPRRTGRSSRPLGGGRNGRLRNGRQLGPVGTRVDQASDHGRRR